VSEEIETKPSTRQQEGFFTRVERKEEQNQAFPSIINLSTLF
jgi:hypothetical protein